jgi:type III secretion protein J
MKTPIRRRTLPLLFGLFFSLFMVGCTMSIQHGLTERQANRIITLFAANKIDAMKLADTSGREVKWTIMVNKSDVANAIALLQKHNLPRDPEKGFEGVYGQTGMIPTATEEKAKYLMALSGEVNNTLRQIDGVLDARVHLVIPRDQILRNPNDPKPQPRASVLLVTRKSPAPAVKMSDIQRLVAGSLEDLEVKNVTVVFAPQGDAPTADGVGGDALAGTSNVLGLKVAADDANKLKMILGLVSFLMVIFVILFIWSFIRSASLKSQLRAMGQ